MRSRRTPKPARTGSRQRAATGTPSTTTHSGSRCTRLVRSSRRATPRATSGPGRHPRGGSSQRRPVLPSMPSICPAPWWVSGTGSRTIYLEGGPLSGTVLEHCPGAACPGDNLYFDWKAYGGGGSQAIIARVRCGSTGGCSNAEVRGGIRSVELEHHDRRLPAACGSGGGTLASSGWKSGTVPVTVSVDDNVGVKQTRALIDGVPKAVSSRACDYARKVPCPNGADSLDVALGGLGDGPHSLSGPSGRFRGQPRRFSRSRRTGRQHAARRARGLSLDGGSGWRADEPIRDSLDEPAQRFAPIAAARYVLCPSRRREQ